MTADDLAARRASKPTLDELRDAWQEAGRAYDAALAKEPPCGEVHPFAGLFCEITRGHGSAHAVRTGDVVTRWEYDA